MPATLPHDPWYRAVTRTFARLYYRRVRVVSLAPLPPDGPALWVALHRNGAVDGMVYKTAFPRLTFLVSTQLLRSPLGRLFFTGIPVTRAKDVARRGDGRSREALDAANAAALARGVELMADGGALCVFPEGTSDLGARHLPFKPGAARTLAAALERGVAVRVIPMAICYGAPEVFRSDVTVVTGAEIDTTLPGGLPPDERVARLHARIGEALEALAVEAEDEEALRRIEGLAALEAGDTAGAAWYAVQRRLARDGVPDDVVADWRIVDDAVRRGTLASDAGLVARSRRGAAWSALWLLLQLLLMAPGALLAAPALLAARLAGNRLADARNTIAFWRLLAGVPVLAVWSTAVAVTALVLRHPWWIAAYAAALWVTLHLWHEARARLVRLRNFRAPDAELQALIRLTSAGAGGDAPGAESRESGTALLPHEIAWLAFLFFVWTRLVAAEGIAGPESLLWFALLAATAAPIALCVQRPSLASWRARLGVFLFTMNAAYFRLGQVVAHLGGRSHDALLQRVDTALFGAPLPVLLDRWKHPVATELLSACYFLLFPYILVSCVRYGRRAREDLDTAQRFYAGLFTVYAIGFLGYFLVPAQGPYLDLPHAFAHPLVGGPLTRLNEGVVRAGTNRVDVFPSLHVAASAFMLLFDRRHAPWRFRAYLLPAIGLWISTIYLRFHYGIDVICGFALALACLAIAERRPAAPAVAPASAPLP